MTKVILLAVGATVIVLLAAGTFFRNQNVPPNLTLESLTGEMLASDANSLLVDIRTPQEWQETGVIEGALLVTYSDADSFLKAIAPHLEQGQSIALVCRSGNRTSRAARQISAKTDTPVIDVAGGMIRIVREGYVPVPASRAMQ
jgi:rhodanese-related sulfurtransferase